ncbi:MAG: hypothetical protein MJ169_01680 [Treponema sp.]|nr:hypothetical protein [Treponema sp.]
MIKLGFQSCRYNNLFIEQEMDMALKSRIDFFDVFFDGFNSRDIENPGNVKLMEDITIHLPLDFTSLASEDKEAYFDYINRRKPKCVTVSFDNLSYEELEMICTNIKGPVVAVTNTIGDKHRIYGCTFYEFLLQAKMILERKMLKVNVTLDTGVAKLNGQNPVEYAKNLIKDGFTILSVHLHDNDGSTDYHWPAGSVANGIDFENFVRVLEEQGREVWGVIDHWNNNYNALEYLRSI